MSKNLENPENDEFCQQIHQDVTKCFTVLLSDHRNEIERLLLNGRRQLTIPLSALTSNATFHVWMQQLYARKCVKGKEVPRTMVSSYKINAFDETPSGSIPASVTFEFDILKLVPSHLKTKRVFSQVQDLYGGLFKINHRFRNFKSDDSKYKTNGGLDEFLELETQLLLKRQRSLFDYCRFNSKLNDEECKQLLPYFATF